MDECPIPFWVYAFITIASIIYFALLYSIGYIVGILILLTHENCMIAGIGLIVMAATQTNIKYFEHFFKERR